MRASPLRSVAFLFSLLLAACSNDSRTLPTEAARATESSHTESVLPFVQLAEGYDHTCGITTAGKAYCWGGNSNGQLGNGLTSTPIDGTKYLVVGGHTWAQISAGDYRTCGVTTGGEGYCWGRNIGGSLGIGSTKDKKRPQLVAGNHIFREINTGYVHTCGIDTNGLAYCWGFNGEGQLGVGSHGLGSNKFQPKLVHGGHKWAHVVPSVGDHTCGVTRSGDGYCWGRGIEGQLGGGGSGMDVPSLVGGGHKWQSISPGGVHTCGIAKTGVGYCWGFTSDGALGVGQPSSASYVTPTRVGAQQWLVITAGEKFSCGIGQGGATNCWGDNSVGQLGFGQVTGNKFRPRPVTGGLLFTSISAGRMHACGFAGGVAYCWGSNAAGQLGDGTTSDQPAPVLVQ
jgi:alpha-tubulin suppressor-like RCC1 family protein